MTKVSKNDILSVPEGGTVGFELENYKACLSARTYTYQLSRTEGLNFKTKIIGTRFFITRV